MGALIADSNKFIYFTGLRNAHAMETQAIELLTRQVGRLEHYPELEARMREHLEESKIQRTRLEEVLHAHDETFSALKEAVLGFGGNFAAMAHMAAGDEIIKDTLANYMFEHFEIATYAALEMMAYSVGDTAGVTAVRASRGEEEAMAGWLREHIAPTTLKFLERSAAGVTADH